MVHVGGAETLLPSRLLSLMHWSLCVLRSPYVRDVKTGSSTLRPHIPQYKPTACRQSLLGEWELQSVNNGGPLVELVAYIGLLAVKNACKLHNFYIIFGVVKPRSTSGAILGPQCS